MTDDPFDGPAAVGPIEEDDTRAPMQRGRYLLPTGSGDKIERFTRATNFAKTLADTYLLSLWQQRMAVKGVTMRADLYASVASTSIDDRNRLNELVETAKEVAGTKTRANLGTALHTFTEQHDRGENPIVPPPWDRDLAAYTSTLERLGVEILPDMIERTVLCSTYKIAGTFDRVVRLRRDLPVRLPGDRLRVLKKGTRVIFDLKTGAKLDFGFTEFCIQLALYANAESVYNAVTRRMEPMPEVNREVALVCHLPVGEGRATVIPLDIAAGWEAAKLAQAARDWQKAKVAGEPVGTVEVGTDPDEIVEWEKRAAMAETVAELSALRREAIVARAWTPAVEAAALARRDTLLGQPVAG